MHCSQNKYRKNDEYFSECVHQKTQAQFGYAKGFDVCNQEKIQVIWYAYLRDDAPAEREVR